MRKIAVIGSGFSGLSCALCFFSKKGYKVTIFEKMKLMEEGLDSLKLMDLLLIWDQVGIGCRCV